MTFQGLLNTKCNIEVLTKTQNATTRQFVETWAIKYSNIKCRIDGAEGQEFLGQNKEINKATHILFIDNNHKIEMYKNRIKVGSITYNILQVTDAGGHGHHFEIYLERKD